MLLEELVTIGDPQQSALVAEALSALAAGAGDGLRLLGTVRSDFLARITTLPGLGDDINRAVYLLRPMGPEKLREAVTGPALLKGVAFESDELVDQLVTSTAHTDGGLPLLQFALAELWDVRAEKTITKAALQSIGGVAGALARHADHVISALPPDPRASARRILMSLVTIEGTRARRIEEELTHSDPHSKSALDALVRGRLLVARDTPEGTAYEVAHEALIKGWDSLRKWLDEHQEARAVKQRLETSTSEWVRIGRAKEALWGARQIAELGLLQEADIGPRERSFIAASRARENRKRQLRRALLVSIPVLLGILYGTVQLAARRNLEHKVNTLLAQGNEILNQARLQSVGIEGLRQQSFAAFDAKDRDKGEDLWKKAREGAVQTDRKLALAANTLESALALDSRRDDIRDRLAESLFERAVGAERDRQERLRDDLLARLAVYDTSGTWQARWAAPGRLKLTTNPAGAQVELGRYVVDERQRRKLTESRLLGTTPIAELPLVPGSYLLTITAPGRETVFYPFVLERGETLAPDVTLLRTGEVPQGFQYIPQGRFLFGFVGEDQLRKMFFNAAPMHQIQSEGYFISKYEVTFEQWIKYLRSLPKAERIKRTPQAGGAGLNGLLELKETADGKYKILLKIRDAEWTATEGALLSIPGRALRARQDWLRFPVGGVSFEDATAYADWLSSTGQLRGARVCNEQEWERATRGADERIYPHGDRLEPEDANYDETYGKVAASFGPDVVGSHPLSRSPFGVDDLAGNHFEWTLSTLSKDEPVVRSSSYLQDSFTQYAPNRNLLDPTTKLADVGIRICASVPINR